MLRRNFLKITLPLAFAGKATATPAIEPELTFGVIADPQYADAEPQWGRFYRNSLTKLADAAAIPREVLDALPSPEEIQRKSAEAAKRAAEALAGQAAAEGMGPAASSPSA